MLSKLFSIFFSISLLFVGSASAFDWKAHSGKTITFLMSEHPVLKGIRSVLPDFERDTGIKVKVNAMAEDVYFDKMEVALRSGKGVADVHFCPMDSTAFNQYLAGLLEPLDQFIFDSNQTSSSYDIADFPDGFLQSTRFPGGPGSNHYCIPASFESYILFYNKNHINKYVGGKVPETFDDLIFAANKVKKMSNGDVMGMVVRGKRTDTAIDTITGVVYNSWGSRSVNYPQNIWFEDGWQSPQMDHPAIQRGLAQYAGMMSAGPDDIKAYDWNEAGTAFQQNLSAFFVDASLFGPWFEEADSPSKGNVGYAVLPPQVKEGKSYTAHWQWGLGMPANAPEKGAAWYFIQYMTNKMNEPKIGAFHGGAARMSTWSNNVYTKTLNPDYVSATLESMKTTRSSVVMKEGWSKYALEIVDTIHRIHGGEAALQSGQKANIKFLNYNK